MKNIAVLKDSFKGLVTHTHTRKRSIGDYSDYEHCLHLD